ncbi:MAG: glutamate-1-semialdehyde 2,1-aminomutase [Cytophagaceae bacterium]|nr:glutamate-1-semialdehyde 2,1-aminomutase [Cytophagaceae bacterium]MDW8455362.1 glutamate-1-semialdehyde 2,1-aminomutase [Cytophagaceae bacterium]
MNKNKSSQWFQRACQVIPGGVNSPVRAFKSVGGNPVFIERAQGAYLFDVDGNRYIDLINSWGPMILGHAQQDILNAVEEAIHKSFSFGAPTEKEVLIAELICEMVPSIEKIRFVNSGTEATMSAIRLARGYTGKNKILKFEGCYHGHGDSFLIAAGSGAATTGVPDSAGVPQSIANDTLTAPYNDLRAVENIIDSNPDQIAAIIVEPVAGNMGCVPPENGFLQGLRNICDKKNIVLIFDEVMTGFRLAQGGAQQLFNVIPDLTTLGKVIGGGLPVGAYGGKKEIMDYISPSGPVYQAGTLSGNPIAVSAGLATLRYLYQHNEIYVQLEQITQNLCQKIEHNIAKTGVKATVNRVGSMFTLFFTEQKVTNFSSAKTSDTETFAKYFNLMLEKGIYLAPSQFEALFVSAEINQEIVEYISQANLESLRKISAMM